MIRKQKYIGFKLCLALYVTGLFAPAIGFAGNAAEKTRPAPLHIKIKNTQSNAQKSTINITVGKVRAQDISEKTPPTPTSTPTRTPAHTPAKISSPSTAVKITPKLIKTRACHEDMSQNSNRYKNLANSLGLYIKAQNRDPSLIDDIYQASLATHTDFELLIITAMIESDLGRVTHTSTSSARGIFQYIEPTWLSLMKRYGARIGYNEHTHTIQHNDRKGVPHEINNSQLVKNDLLDLRHNTKIASLIKAYQLKDEASILAKYKGGERINATDYYIVHMLGLPQARTFYALLQNESDNILANLENKGFKEAIRLNPAFFYDAQNNALNAAEAYTQFHRKISQQYKRLHAISTQYGDGTTLPRSRCNLPRIQTASITQ